VVVLAVSLLAVAGGIATAWLVPSPQPGSGVPIRPRALGAIWSERQLRASVFGYFGHMWELYTLYALLPVLIATRFAAQDVSLLAFWSIAAGALGCAGGGLLARRFGSARIAQWQLGASCLCCLASPWLLCAPLPLFVAWLLVWGTTVAGDSPQFSALTAATAPKAFVGSALTIVNCIGFALTVPSIALAAALSSTLPAPWWFVPVAIGPRLGLIATRALLAASRG
jgi:MFS family permease